MEIGSLYEIVLGPKSPEMGVHPYEKVIGIFFRHNFFTINFPLFVLVFTHNICEVSNNNSLDLGWISIICYIPMTF